MSSLVRSRPKTLPEHCGEQREPFLLPLNCRHRDRGWRSHVPAVTLTDGPISEFLSLPACSFLPLLTCAAATHQRWGDRGTQWGTDPTPHTTEKDTGWKPRFLRLCCLSDCLIISKGTGRGGVAFYPPPQVVTTDLYVNFCPPQPDHLGTQVWTASRRGDGDSQKHRVARVNGGGGSNTH